MGRVSVIIPGRNEPYFQKTVDSVLESAVGDVEVIAVVDGEDTNPPLASTDSRVRIIRLDNAIGQRAAYNLGVRESTGQYVMKIDAHAKLSHGFDEMLQSHCPDDAVVLPEMRRLDVKKWADKPRGRTHFMFFGLDLYCHFWQDYNKREAAQCEYPEVMTGQGSCWFCTRAWNDHIQLLDERVGSWGNVGIEVSLRTWLCGGSQIVNRKAWQAHWFRKDEGGFTYSMTGRQVAKAHAFTRENYYFKDNAFNHQTRPFRFVIEKFAPVPGWEAYLTDGYKSPRAIVYTTDNRIDESLAGAVRKNLQKVAGPIPIISVSQKPIDFGRNVCVGDIGKSYPNFYKQFLAGCEAAPEGSIVYLCDHDVFYHTSHFAHLPSDREHAEFDTNRFYWTAGLPYFWPAEGKQAHSMGVAYRELWIEHAKARLDAWDRGEKPVMDIPYRSFTAERPSVDIRHANNLIPHGEIKRSYMEGRRTGPSRIPGWGGVQHFQSKSGYKAAPTVVPTSGHAANVLKQLFADHLPQSSPIRIRSYRREKLGSLFARLGYEKGAEIGVKSGVFSEILCKSIPQLQLICVDPWVAYAACPKQQDADRCRAAAMERLKPYAVTVIDKTSLEAALDVEDGSLDFVYIDADHAFDSVMQDLIAWSPKVRTGGIVSGHDYYYWRFGGVVAAVDAFTRAHMIHEWWLTGEKTASFFWVQP